ncbi:MAG: glycosyltransferase family 39 protein [Solirubrobacteraceae bacterium]
MLVPVRTGRASAPRALAAAGALKLEPEIWFLVGLTLLAAALRLATISSQSYWVDEATTVHELHLGLGGLIHALRVNESTPPLYYLLAWGWVKLFGSGEAALRSLSAVAGIALVPIAYGCGRELVSRAAGLVAAALVSVNPFLIWYSQEARAYMLFAALSGCSLWFFARSRRAPSARNLTGWTVFSVLAVLSHFFAGFLIAPEVVLLALAHRRRAVLIAAAGVLAVQLAVIPLALGDLSHPLLGWIKQFSLSVRVQQVPVSFGLGTLYQSSLVNHGLLGAAVLGLVVVVLLVRAGGRPERRGAGTAALLAGTVILVPLVLAWVGRDYFVPRNMIPAWIPLAVVLGAACTVPRARLAGGLLAGVLLVGSVAAGNQIDSHAEYQRPDWRGVAQALGSTSQPRAIIAYDGQFAAQPLAIYLPHVPWSTPARPVSVMEVDVVGSPWQIVGQPLPPGVRLLARRSVGGFLVARFSVASGWRLAPGAIAARAPSLLGPGPPNPAVLIQGT